MNVVLTPATIAKLELHEGDVIIVRSTVNLSPAHAQRLHDILRDELPSGHKILMLAPNLSIEVLAKP